MTFININGFVTRTTTITFQFRLVVECRRQILHTKTPKAIVLVNFEWQIFVKFSKNRFNFTITDQWLCEITMCYKLRENCKEEISLKYITHTDRQKYMEFTTVSSHNIANQSLVQCYHVSVLWDLETLVRNKQMWEIGKLKCTDISRSHIFMCNFKTHSVQQNKTKNILHHCETQKRSF